MVTHGYENRNNIWPLWLRHRGANVLYQITNSTSEGSEFFRFLFPASPLLSLFLSLCGRSREMNRDKSHGSVEKKWFIPRHFQGTSWINSDGGKHWGLSDYFILSLWGQKKGRKEKRREGCRCSLWKCCVLAAPEEDNTWRILQRWCHEMHIGLVKGKNKCGPFVLWYVLNTCKQEGEYI